MIFKRSRKNGSSKKTRSTKVRIKAPKTNEEHKDYRLGKWNPTPSSKS